MQCKMRQENAPPSVMVTSAPAVGMVPAAVELVMNDPSGNCSQMLSDQYWNGLGRPVGGGTSSAGGGVMQPSK